MNNEQNVSNETEGANENEESSVIETIKSIAVGIGCILVLLVVLIISVWLMEVLGISAFIHAFFPNSFLEAPLFGIFPSPHDLIAGLMGW